MPRLILTTLLAKQNACFFKSLNNILGSVEQGLQPKCGAALLRRIMHHIGVKKSNLLDSGSTETSKLASADNDQPLCPKPRRIGPDIPELLKPLGCNKHSQHNSYERSGILNLISEKDIFDGREYVCTKCSPACYSGSPPSRTHNPLVHDVQFLHQMDLVSPFTRTKLSDKFGFGTSASPI